jgi:hypothetical protein
VDAAVDAPGNAALTIKLYNHFPFVEGDTENADFVAGQDGDGAWLALTGDRGVYTMPRSSASYGVIVVCRFATVTVTKVFLKVAAEGLVHTTTSCHVDPDAEKVSVTVAVKNIPDGLNAAVTGPTTASTTGVDADLVLDLAPRVNELLAGLVDNQLENVQKLVRIPPFTPQAGQSFTIDFATMGTDPDQLPLTVSGATPDAMTAGVSTTTGEYTFPSGPGSTYAALPVALRRAGDRHVVQVLAGSAFGRADQVTPGPVTLDLLPALSGADFATTDPDMPWPMWTVPALPAPRGQARLIMIASTAGSPGRRLQVFLARARLGGATSASYTLPDLGALIPGLPKDVALPGRTRISWSIQADDITTLPDGSTIQVGTSASGSSGP